MTNRSSKLVHRPTRRSPDDLAYMRRVGLRGFSRAEVSELVNITPSQRGVTIRVSSRMDLSAVCSVVRLLLRCPSLLPGYLPN